MLFPFVMSNPLSYSPRYRPHILQYFNHRTISQRFRIVDSEHSNLDNWPSIWEKRLTILTVLPDSEVVVVGLSLVGGDRGGLRVWDFVRLGPIRDDANHLRLDYSIAAESSLPRSHLPD